MNNQYFIKKAMSLLEKPIETKIQVTRTITFNRTNEGIKSVVADDYRTRALTKGDEICLDFGTHQVGYLNLKFSYTGSHPDAPVLIRVHFAENPNELFENPDEYNGWICASWIEKEEFHIDILPIEKHIERRYAFRYVKIQIVDISSKFRLIVSEADCTAVSGVSDSQLLPYRAQGELHRKLDSVACRTLHNCMQVVFEDGPKRDRRLWIGDLRLQALANYVTYQKNDMVKACLYLFAGLPMEDGRVGACLFLDPKPEVDDTSMFDYSLFFINTLLDYYEETKDFESLSELWPTALKQIEIAETYLDERYLVRDSDVLGWCFVDWNLNLNKQASAQGILLFALSAAIKICQILNDVMEEEKIAELYLNCRNAANDFLWDRTKKCYVSGTNKQVSMASQVWMILGEAVEGKKAIELLEHVEKIENCEKMVTPYMYHNYIAALLQSGDKGLALKKIETYWGGMIEQGADTFWELYNPENVNESPYGGTIVNSYCHAWSCGPAYFLREFY